MTESTDKPDVIQLDYVKDGKANILIHWDILETQRIDEISEKSTTIWTYSECRIKEWVLPQAYDTIADVQTYLDSISEELLDWAKGSKVNLKKSTK